MTIVPPPLKMHHHRLVMFMLIQIFAYANSQPFIGINYGAVADNLPPPSQTTKLLRSTTISKVRLYNADPAVIQSLAGTNISIVIGTANADIPSLATSPSFASQWVSSNVAPHVPSSLISVVSVGNEVLNSGDTTLYSQLLPAMQNLQNALPPNSNIKVSTVHSMAVMSASDPPSSGAFHADLDPFLNPILQFLQGNGGAFMINPYPYFAYRDDPRPDTLSYCLFQPNPGRLDPNTKITYMNMFDAQVDAIKSALNSAGFKNVEIVVAETGWPYKGDDGEVGATVQNAAAYNGNLAKHLNTMVGTPLMPGKSVDTYIFALYDEDLKPGPTSERSFGLFRPDSTAIYDVGLSKSSSTQLGPSPANPSPLVQLGPSPANLSPPTAMITPAQPQPQPAVVCHRLTGTDCYSPSPVVPSSVGPQAINLVYKISVTLTVNQLLGLTFSRSFGFSLSFLFLLFLPLMLPI